MTRVLHTALPSSLSKFSNASCILLGFYQYAGCMSYKLVNMTSLITGPADGQKVMGSIPIRETDFCCLFSLHVMLVAY